MLSKEASKKIEEFTKKQLERRAKLNKEFVTTRSILGNDWAMYFFLLGGREAGKSYDVLNFCVRQWKQKHRPFYWLRLTPTSTRRLLANNGEKLIDPDLKRRYDLDINVQAGNVYEVTERTKPLYKENGELKQKSYIIKKELMCRVMDLATSYNDKGSGIFDNEFLNDPNMYYNIVFDEMNRERHEKNTFDIVYAFKVQIENILRSTKKRVRIILIGNTLEEASDMLCAFNFIPETFGRYYLKKRRAVIDYIAPSEKYLKRRKGTATDLISNGNDSNFSNKIEVDKTLISKERLKKPISIIKFTKSKGDWFTLWNNNIIARYNKENKPSIAMLPYLDDKFIIELRDTVYSNFDLRVYKYRDLATFKFFQKNLELIRPKR